MGILVADSSGGFGEGATPLQGACTDFDWPAVCACVVGGEVHPQSGDTRRRTNEEILRRRGDNDKYPIDQAVVVAGVGDAVRTVVVIARKVDIAIGLLQDFAVEAREVAPFARLKREIGPGRVAPDIALGRHLAAQAQAASRHFVVEMTDTAWAPRIE